MVQYIIKVWILLVTLQYEGVITASNSTSDIMTTDLMNVTTVTQEVQTFPDMTVEDILKILDKEDPMCVPKAITEPLKGAITRIYGNGTTAFILCSCQGLFCPGQTEEEINEKIIEMSKDNKVFIDSFTIAAFVSYGVIIILGLIGNVLVITTILVVFRPINITNMFIISLSVADLLVCCVCVPLRLHNYVLDTWLHGDGACKTVMYIYYALFMCSVFTLTAMSLERWFVICFPMKAQYISTVSRTRVIIAVSWILAFLLAIPVAFQTKLVITFCSIAHKTEGDWSGPLYLYILLAVFFFPCCIIGFAYFHTSVVLWKSLKVARKLKGENGAVKSNETRSRIQVIRMLITIWVIFVLCWCPYLLLNVLINNANHVVKMSTDIHNHVFSGLNLASMANSAVNPFLYAFMSQQFRRGFVCLLTGTPLRTKRDTSVSHVTGASTISMSNGASTVSMATKTV